MAWSNAIIICIPIIPERDKIEAELAELLKLIEELKSVKGDEEAILDRFYKDLEFGTGGLRGIMGAGPNRMNKYTVGKATFGLAKYLMKKHEGEEYTARILSVQSFGFFCVLDNTCEGLVPVSSLDGFYTYNEDMGTLASRYAVFRAGDTVRIRVKFADVQRHKTEFEYLEKLQQQ